MKEQEMRARLDRLLETGVRRAAASAVMGIGVMVVGGGCVTKYMAPAPESSTRIEEPFAERSLPVPAYMAPMPVETDGAGAPDAGRTSAHQDRLPIARYMARMPPAPR